MHKAFDKTKKQNTLKSQSTILSTSTYEKEIYICVEDILMYAIEKRIINVMKECFARNLMLSVQCQIRLVISEQFGMIKDDFYQSPNLKTNNFFSQLCSLYRGLQFLMTNGNINDCREESFFASLMLKRLICVCHLYEPKEHEYLLQFVQNNFIEITETNLQAYISNKLYISKYKQEMVRFARSIKKLIENDEKRKEYFECQMEDQFDRGFWVTLRYLLSFVIKRVKDKLPGLVIEELLLSNLDRLEDGYGDENRSRLISTIFMKKHNLDEKELMTLLHSISTPNSIQNVKKPDLVDEGCWSGCSESDLPDLSTVDHVIKSHDDVTSVVSSPNCSSEDKLTNLISFLGSLDLSDDLGKNLIDYYSNVCPEEEDHVCGTDDEDGFETNFGFDVDSMFFPNFFLLSDD